MTSESKNGQRPLDILVGGTCSSTLPTPPSTTTPPPVPVISSTQLTAGGGRPNCANVSGYVSAERLARDVASAEALSSGSVGLSGLQAVHAADTCDNEPPSGWRTWLRPPGDVSVPQNQAVTDRLERIDKRLGRVEIGRPDIGLQGGERTDNGNDVGRSDNIRGTPGVAAGFAVGQLGCEGRPGQMVSVGGRAGENLNSLSTHHDVLSGKSSSRSFGLDPALKGVKVLVVEDEADVRRLMVAVLRVYGASVSTAANVEEGLLRFYSDPPDVLLSDIGMPGRDGYDLIRQIRKHEQEHPGNPRVPAAAVTAFAQPADRDKALEAGFDRHVIKPLRAPQLVEVISGLVGCGPSH